MHSGTALIDVFEVKLPGQGDASEVVDVTFHHLADVAAQDHQWPTSKSRSSATDRDPIFDATAVADASHRIDENRRAGIKIRCGGLDASAVPTVEAVAAAISAGLAIGSPAEGDPGSPPSHSSPRRDPSARRSTVFSTSSRRRCSRGPTCSMNSIVREIIAEEDPKAFRLTDSTLGWRDLETGFEGVVDGRLHAMTSFGSCSFTEPRDDLADLGWL